MTCLPRLRLRLLLLGALLCLSAAPARAGPREARLRWREAQALGHAPWQERVRTLREVRRETVPTDGYFGRALAAEARVLREAGHAAAAAAAESWAATAGPRREPDRLGHALTAARAWIEDGDPVGARPLLEDVLESAGASASVHAGSAFELLGRLAAEAGDERALDLLLRRLEHDLPDRLDLRLSLLDRVGLLALDRGDALAAHRAHAAQRRTFASAEREGEETARRASRAWLALRLPDRLLQAQSEGEAPPPSTPR